jgi:hypothetical protein
MKKSIAIIGVVVILGIMGFSVSFLTPTAEIVQEGYLYFDTFNPAFGIRWGLFGFLETGVSQVNQGAYIKVGFNEIYNKPFKLSMFYSNSFHDHSAISIACGYDFEDVYVDTGVIYSEAKEFVAENGETIEKISKDYSFFAKTSIEIIEKETSKSYINIEGTLNYVEDFNLDSYSIAFYGVQNFKNNLWILEGLDLYAGLNINKNIADEDFSLLENVNVVLGLSTKVKVF